MQRVNWQCDAEMDDRLKKQSQSSEKKQSDGKHSLGKTAKEAKSQYPQKQEEFIKKMLSNTDFKSASLLLSPISQLFNPLNQNLLNKIFTQGPKEISQILESLRCSSKQSVKSFEEYTSHCKYETSNLSPSTGLGKFDISHDPKNSATTVAVKVFYEFEPTRNIKEYGIEEPLKWNEKEKEEWKKRYFNAITSAWSKKFSFSVELIGKDGNPVKIVTTPQISVLESSSKSDSHFYLVVEKIPKDEFAGSSVQIGGQHVKLDSEDTKKTSKCGKYEQRGAVHEFGHMLGIGDEYRDSGFNPHHADLTESLFQTKVEVKDDQRVMSCGEEVNILHYSTILEALRKITNLEWK